MAKKSDLISQSAILPYRLRKTGPEFLLITSIGSGRWVLPKGYINSNMTPRQSAIKEAFEEAGINGRVPKTSFGIYTYSKKDEPGVPHYQVEVFIMRVISVLNTWPEELRRTREWMSPKKASDSVEEEPLSRMMLDFAGELER